MPNLRIIANNAADRATLVASSTGGALAVTNLQTNRKSDVWQSAAATTSARLSAAWTAPEAIQGVALPFCNWSPTASWRVRLTGEAQATNLLVNTEALAGASWTNNGTTRTASYGTAPSGATAASTLINGGSAYQAATLVSGAVYTYSYFAKAGTGTGAALYKDGAGTLISATYTFATGLFTGTAGATATAIGNGWFRIAITFTATATSGNFHVLPSGGSVEVWGAQLEAGSRSSYYPSAGSAATRPLGYIDTWQSYAYDSGSVPACPAAAIVLPQWTAAQSASAYAYGGGAIARHWLPASVSAYGMAIDIVDANNLQSALGAARLVCGAYWSPTYNASAVSDIDIDTVKQDRNDAGDLMSDAGTIHKRVPISLEYMPATDRTTLKSLLRGSRANPIFVSIFPEVSDLELERDHTVYGQRMTDSEIAVQAAIVYGTKIEVESI